MASPSTHQDSPKVPEKLMAEMVNRFVWAATTGPQHPEATPEKAVETIIAPLLSALLSDEAVTAATNAIGGHLGDIDREVRDALQAAIEQVGGGDDVPPWVASNREDRP